MLRAWMRVLLREHRNGTDAGAAGRGSARQCGSGTAAGGLLRDMLTQPKIGITLKKIKTYSSIT